MEHTSQVVAAVASRCLRSPESASIGAGSALTQHEPNNPALEAVAKHKCYDRWVGRIQGIAASLIIVVLVCVFGCQNAEISGQKVRVGQDSKQRVEGASRTTTTVDPLTGEVKSVTDRAPTTEDVVKFDADVQGTSARASGDGTTIAKVENKAPQVVPPPVRPGAPQAKADAGDSKSSVAAYAGNTAVRVICIVLGLGVCGLGILALKQGRPRNAVAAFAGGGALVFIGIAPQVVEFILAGLALFLVGWLVWTVIKSRSETTSDGHTKGAFESGLDTIVAQGPTALGAFLKNLRIAAPDAEFNKVEQYLKDNHFKTLLDALGSTSTAPAAPAVKAV